MNFLIILFIIVINVTPYFIEYKFIRIKHINILPYTLWFNALIIFYFVLPEYFIN